MAENERMTTEAAQIPFSGIRAKNPAHFGICELEQLKLRSNFVATWQHIMVRGKISVQIEALTAFDLVAVVFLLAHNLSHVK